MRSLAAVAIIIALAAFETKGETTMCTGAEAAPAAEAAKGASEVGAAAAAGEGAGATATSIAAANAAGAAGGDALGTLIAGNAGTWGVTVAPEVSAAAAPYLAGAAAGAASGGAGMSTFGKITAGASAVNAGTGVLQAMSARKGIPAAPALTQPTTMPTTDDLAARRARAALIQQFSARRGRSSTILSNDTLGGN